MSVAVVKQGKVIYAKGFGFADIENEVPAAPETVYRLGSVTKQFTSAMIMQLVTEGKLTLDQPINTILKDIPASWSKITVRQLLNHTSGIKSYTELKDLFDDAAMKPVTPRGILKTIEKEPLDFEPGSKWHYDNTGYEVLGIIIENLDGRPYSKSLQARILDPLEMKHTFFTSERTIVKHRAQGYSRSPKGFLHAPYLNMDWPYAAGSMESTTLDLAKWDAALYGNRILTQAARDRMWTVTTLSDGKTQDYGFGWSLETRNGIKVVEHGGGIHGFTTFIKRVPSKSVSVIVLTNCDSADTSTIARDVLVIVDPSLKVAPPKSVVSNDSISTMAHGVLLSVISGNVDRKLLTPAFAKILTPELLEGAKMQLDSLGELSRFELISSDEKDGKLTRSYRVTLGTTDLKMVLVLTKERLIDGLGLRP